MHNLPIIEEAKESFVELDITNNDLSEGELNKVEIEDALGREISLDSEPVGKDLHLQASTRPDKRPQTDAEMAQAAHLQVPNSGLDNDDEVYSISGFSDEDFN